MDSEDDNIMFVFPKCCFVDSNLSHPANRCEGNDDDDDDDTHTHTH